MGFLEIYFLAIIVTSLFTAGLRNITAKHKIGHPLRVFACGTFPEIIHKPLLSCADCMPSFWGSVVWALMLVFTGNYVERENVLVIVLMWAGVCVSSSWVSGTIWSCKKYLDKINGDV